MRPTKFGRMVADRACVLIGGTRSPAFGRTMGRLIRVNSALVCATLKVTDGLRYNVRAYGIVSVIGDSLVMQFHLPFQTDRANRAVVGLIFAKLGEQQ